MQRRQVNLPVEEIPKRWYNILPDVISDTRPVL